MSESGCELPSKAGVGRVSVSPLETKEGTRPSLSDCPDVGKKGRRKIEF